MREVINHTQVFYPERKDPEAAPNILSNSQLRPLTRPGLAQESTSRGICVERSSTGSR